MLLFWGALCLWAGTAFAQDSSLERRMDQAWRDAMQGKGRAFEPDVKSRFAAKAVDTKPAFVKAFYFPRSFTAKDFLTGNYKGSKDFWMGDFKYDTKPAATKGNTVPNATTKYPLREMPVTTSSEAAKTYAAATYPTRASTFRGTAQDRLKAEGAAALAGKNAVGWQGKMDTMTLDEIRNLLNKTK